jgi:sphinganine-1-phosphate aldolase
LRHVGREQPFLEDLRASVEEIISSPNKAEGNAAIYGMTSSLPPGPVNDLLKIYNDVIFKL